MYNSLQVRPATNFITKLTDKTNLRLRSEARMARTLELREPEVLLHCTDRKWCRASCPRAADVTVPATATATRPMLRIRSRQTSLNGTTDAVAPGFRINTGRLRERDQSSPARIVSFGLAPVRGCVQARACQRNLVGMLDVLVMPEGRMCCGYLPEAASP